MFHRLVSSFENLAPFLGFFFGLASVYINGISRFLEFPVLIFLTFFWCIYFSALYLYMAWAGIDQDNKNCSDRYLVIGLCFLGCIFSLVILYCFLFTFYVLGFIWVAKLDFASKGLFCMFFLNTLFTFKYVFLVLFKG